MTSDDDTGGTAGNSAGDPVGGVGEEATRLITALRDWAQKNGSEYAGAASSAASGLASSMSSVNEHIGTGSQDCRYCPLCQLISAFRDTSPEVREHLAAAASSLVQAAAGAMATKVPDQDDRGDAGTGVQKVDLDEDAQWTDERQWEEDPWD